MSTSPSPAPRKCLVRRRLQPQHAESPMSPKKTVVVVRRICPGQTLRLENGGSVAMADNPALIESVPDTLVVPARSRPSTDDDVAGAVSESQIDLYQRHLKDIADAKLVEMKQQQDRLNNLLCGELLLATREGRILERWQKMNEVWERTRRHLSKQVGVSSERLSMDQGNEYREKIEALHLLNTATPLENKITSAAAWKMTLRGETSTFVPIGNVFSGLFCEVKNSPPCMIETIRKPTRNRDNQTDRAAGSNWRNSSVYRQRCHQLRNRIAAVRPHEIVLTDALEIVGQDLFELRRCLPGYSTDPASQHVADAQARVDAAPADATTANGNDQTLPLLVRLDVSGTSVEFHVSSTETEALAGVTITNTGTTAIHFRLRPLSKADAATSDDHGFSWLDAEVTLLPEQSTAVAFRFRPRQPGLSLLSLALETLPKQTNAESATVLYLKGVKHVDPPVHDERIQRSLNKLNADALRAFVRSFLGELADDAVQARVDLHAGMRSLAVGFVAGPVWRQCELRAEMRSLLMELIAARIVYALPEPAPVIED